jgi:hypothetical protein
MVPTDRSEISLGIIPAQVGIESQPKWGSDKEL